MGQGDSGGAPPLLVVPETLQAVSSALERTADSFGSEVTALTNRGDALLATWKGRAGPTFVEPFEDWKQSAHDVVERLRSAAQLIAQAKTVFVEQDGGA